MFFVGLCYIQLILNRLTKKMNGRSICEVQVLAWGHVFIACQFNFYYWSEKSFPVYGYLSKQAPKTTRLEDPGQRFMPDAPSWRNQI